MREPLSACLEAFDTAETADASLGVPWIPALLLKSLGSRAQSEIWGSGVTGRVAG